jgi:hypothetical protein
MVVYSNHSSPPADQSKIGMLPPTSRSCLSSFRIFTLS